MFDWFDKSAMIVAIMAVVIFTMVVVQ